MAKMPQGRKETSRLRGRQELRPIGRGIGAQTVLRALRLVKGLWARYSTISQVLIVYAISLFALLWFYVGLYGSPVLNSFLNLNAKATGFFAGIFGPEILVQGNLVRAGPFATHIVAECTSLAASAIFLSGVIAFPASLGHKLWGMVLGLVVLSALNIVRTTSLLFIGMLFPSALDVAHILVWQSLMIIVAVVLWILWWRRTSDFERLQS